MRDATADQPRHPIGVVAQRTALSPEVLRAWERRYEVVRPGRSGRGQRLYSDADVERLRLLHAATRGGRSIGQVARLSDEELGALVREDLGVGAEPAPGRGAGGEAERFLEGALAGTEALDAGRVEGALRRAQVALSAPGFLERVVAPLLFEVGARWERGTMSVAHEHLASAVVRRALGRMIEAAEGEEGSPELVVGTPAGQVHEFGAMLAGATASAAGWRVVYLGADLPAEDIAGAVRQRSAAAVALSMAVPGREEETAGELRRLRERLPPWTPVLVGGAAAERYAGVLEEIGATRLPSLPALGEWLDRLRQRALRG